MKKLLTQGVLLLLTLGMLNGCAMVASPVPGIAFTSVRAPLTATNSDQEPTRVGRASVRSILGLIALGDASIQTAAKNGGITNIHHVDYEAHSYMGIMSDFTIIVYGN